MLLSVWDYLRERARDALLAGFQDALDIAEGEGIDETQHEQANRLVARLQTFAARTADAGIESKVVILGSQPVGRPPNGAAFDDRVAKRLSAPVPPDNKAQPAPKSGSRKRRGRPPKQGQG